MRAGTIPVIAALCGWLGCGGSGAPRGGAGTQHTVTVSVSGGGVVRAAGMADCKDRCTSVATEGTRVRFTAVPETGSVFAGWTRDCSGSGSCELLVSQDEQVSATFVLRQTAVKHLLTVVKTGSGTVESLPAGISCASACGAVFDGGTNVSLVPRPEAGWRFAGWGGACSGAGVCSVALLADATVHANFQPAVAEGARRLTVLLGGSGSGQVVSAPAAIDCVTSCGATFPAGASVSLSAVAGSGSTFSGWSGACAGKGTCSVVLGDDASITATFDKNDGQGRPGLGAGDPGAWVPVGPGGGPVLQVAVEPDDARVALAAGLNRMYRTTDGGASWHDTGILPRIGVQAVAFSLAAPRRAWAADFDGRLYSTTDAGATWSAPQKSLADLSPRGVVRLIPHPAEGETVFAATGAGLFVSRDAGSSWALLWAPQGFQSGPPGVCALAFDPGSPATMFSGPCGSNNYGGVFRSTDAGATWTSLRTAMGGVAALAVDPSKPGTEYAALDYGGLPAVISSHDGGQSWSREIYGAIPFAAQTLSLTADGALYAGLSFKGISVSRDDGITWADAGSGIPAHSSAWLSMQPRTRAPYLAGIHGEFGGGGVYRASAEGWRRSSTGMFMETVSGLAFTRAGRLYASTDSGLFWTDDGGGSWSATALDQNTASLAIDPDDRLYVVDWQVLHRSDDGGRTWKDFQSPEGGARLVADAQVPLRLYARGYGLERSDDGGASWKNLIPSGGITAFAIDPGQPRRLYACSDGNARALDGTWITVDPGLRRSEDGGTTWTPSGVGFLAATGCVGIVPDGAHAGRVFAAVAESGAGGSTSGAVYRSDDGGLTWNRVLRHDGDPVQAIAIGGDGGLFAAFPSTVARSDDGGATWRDVARGHQAFRSLLPDRDGKALYAATSAESVLRTVLRR